MNPLLLTYHHCKKAQQKSPNWIQTEDTEIEQTQKGEIESWNEKPEFGTKKRQICPMGVKASLPVMPLLFQTPFLFLFLLFSSTRTEWQKKDQVEWDRREMSMGNVWRLSHRSLFLLFDFRCHRGLSLIVIRSLSFSFALFLLLSFFLIRSVYPFLSFSHSPFIFLLGLTSYTTHHL